MIRRVFNLIGVCVCVVAAYLLVSGGVAVTIAMSAVYMTEPTAIRLFLILVFPWITVRGVFLLADWVLVLLRDLFYPTN